MGTRARNLTPVDLNFATNLTIARRARGMTMQDLSDALRLIQVPLPKSGISKLEAGTRTTTIGEAVAICRVLNVGIDAMIRDELRVEIE